MRLHGSHCFFSFYAGHQIKCPSSHRFHSRRGFVSVICLRNNLSQSKDSSLIFVKWAKRVVLSFKRTIPIQIR